MIADALSRELGLGFEPEDVTLTQGAFGAIALAFRLVMDAGAEVVIPVPGWFCYAPMLRAADLVPVRAALDPERFDLDLAAIEAAITPADADGGGELAAQPDRADLPARGPRGAGGAARGGLARIGARIWLLSDEPYRRIRFDGNGFTSPAAVYPWTLIDYSYGKVLLAPGQRLGYLALSPLLPAAERQALRDGLLSLPDGARLDLSRRGDAVCGAGAGGRSRSTSRRSAARRDRMLGALEQWGYRMTRPEGTFYLWGAAPGRRRGALRRRAGGAGGAA